MIEKHNCRQVGVVVKSHGIAGEIVIRLFDEFSIDDLDTQFLFLDLDGGLVPFYLEEARQKKQADVLVTLEQLKSDKDTVKVIDAPVYVAKETKADEEGEADQPFSAYQLVGYQCQAVGHGYIGEITAIKEIAKNPLFEITDDEDNELLIPIVEHFIAGIDDEQQLVIFDLPEGLVDLD
ncbi:ribosome maturation factor RimM [Carboxylicivirga sp. M1479]|uniref:ribosome maturation factor RimM n=1 Tax=Carboxylicivirga sp. M1479 TaxID=2594476 RepID=UPI001177BDDF|nr:ribosome maturation factor RimM [Carboxylicivirga sp. M1479]TRX71025.1 16S rRNA processing protein RimM [Carboxylicivirga sp. M1479]